MNNNHPIWCFQQPNKNDVVNHAPPTLTDANANAGIIPVKSLTRSSPRLLKTRRRSSVSCSSPLPSKKAKITAPAFQQSMKDKSCSTLSTNATFVRSSPRLLREQQQQEQSRGNCNSPHHPLTENQAVSTPLSTSNFKTKAGPSSQQRKQQRQLTPMKSSRKYQNDGGTTDGATAALHTTTTARSASSKPPRSLFSANKDDDDDILFPVTTTIASSNTKNKRCATKQQRLTFLASPMTITAAEINAMAQKLFENDSHHTDDDVGTTILDRVRCYFLCCTCTLIVCYFLLLTRLFTHRSTCSLQT